MQLFPRKEERKSKHIGWDKRGHRYIQNSNIGNNLANFAGPAAIAAIKGQPFANCIVLFPKGRSQQMRFKSY